MQQSAAASNTPQISIKRAHQKLPQLLSQVAASQAKVRRPQRATLTPHCHPLATLTNFCIKTLAQSFFLLLLLLLLLRALHGCSCNNFSTTNFLFVWLCCNYTQIGRGRKRERKGERESERGQQMEFSIFISLPAVFIAASMLHMKSFWHFHSL